MYVVPYMYIDVIYKVVMTIDLILRAGHPMCQRFARLGIDLVSISHIMLVWHLCHTSLTHQFLCCKNRD